MVAGEEMLAPRLDPLHRATELARGKWNQEIVGIELAADAERAARVAFHHADVRFRHAEKRRQDPAAEERRFGRSPYGHVVPLPFGEDAARLHRHGGMPMHGEALAPAVRRASERGVDVAFHT